MSDLIGVTLKDQYFLRESAGTGGMADVYQAWDKIRSTRMAVKVLRRDLSNNPRFFRTFSQEARLLKQLQHPNIVRLYDFDKEGDIVFIIMDWVEGNDFHKLIVDRHRPFTFDEILHFLEPTCTALNYAHQNQVFHCDVKPANILQSIDGRVLLTDFGVAHLASSQEMGGTVPYMAPEQFTGDTIDARTDIYSLGVTLYEMLSGGELPFRGDSPQSTGGTTRERIAWEQVNLPLTPLSKFNPKLPNGITGVIDIALSKDPDARYKTTMALWEAFEQACRTEKKPGGSPPTTFKSELLTSVQPPPLPQAPPPRSPQSKPARVPPAAESSVKDFGPHLYGRSGELTGRVFPVAHQGTTIGRSSGNIVRLQERSVSRLHTTLFWTKRGVYIRDENSSMGTFVNAQRIPANTPILLRHGDVIQIGYFQVFEFRAR
jgi:eukaryotic-like serine/threonine-protein kinase